MPRTAFYFTRSAMTGFIVSVLLYRNRVSLREAFEGLEPDERKLSRPVLRGPGSREAAWLLGTRQLAERGLSPRKIHSSVGYSHFFLCRPKHGGIPKCNHTGGQ